VDEGYKRWDQWDPDGPDQRSVLREIARHMRRGWNSRDKLGSVGFKAGHQLAHKGWKFGSAVVDLADGSAIPGIKGLRALIVAGRHEWFEQAASLAPGTTVNAGDAPTPVERQWLSNLAGPTTPLSRIDIGEAQIWMIPGGDGWRVAAVFVKDASKSGIKAALELATATGGGCLSILPVVLVFTLVVVSLTAGARAGS
jgi:hypothetical protein